MANKNPHNLPQTLCWDCALSNGSGDCPWAENHTPVDGWEAIPNHISAWPGYDSYCVIECPMFKRDARHGGKDWRWGRPTQKTELSSGDVIKLGLRVCEQAVIDWKSVKDYKNPRLDGQVVWRKDVIDFFNSKWFEHLLTLASDIDPDKCREKLNIPEKGE